MVRSGSSAARRSAAPWVEGTERHPVAPTDATPEARRPASSGDVQAGLPSHGGKHRASEGSTRVPERRGTPAARSSAALRSAERPPGIVDQEGVG